MAVDRQYLQIDFQVFPGVYTFPIEWPSVDMADIHLSYTLPDGTKGTLSRSLYSFNTERTQVTVNATTIDITLVGATLHISRFTPRTQPLDLHPKAPIHPQTLEAGLDRLEYQIQEVESLSATHAELELVAAEFLDITDALNQFINEESVQRIEGDRVLQQNINSIDARVSGGIGQLTSDLAAETAARIAEDSALSSGLQTEINTRTTEDAAIRSALSTETAERISGDTGLRTDLTAETAARITGDTTLTNSVNALSARIEDISNLGHHVGTYSLITDRPTNISQLPPETTPNDFIVIDSDSSHAGLSTRYVIMSIAGDGTITWDTGLRLGTDVTGKADKIVSPVAGNLAGLDATGNITDSGVDASRIIYRPIAGVTGNLIELTDTGVVADSGVTADNILQKVAGVTAGDVAIFKADGTIEDTGIVSSTLMRKVVAPTPGNLVKQGTDGSVIDTGIAADDVALKDEIPDDTTKLPLAGGTMSGIIDMGSNRITNLADPVDPMDAVNLQYLELNGGGGGSGTVDHSRLLNRDKPEQHPISAITGLEDIIAGLEGDTVEGALFHRDANLVILNRNPTHNNAGGTGGTGGFDPTKLPLSGGAMTGPINMQLNQLFNVPDPTNDFDAINLRTLREGVGIIEHNDLLDRNAPDQHDISAITGLQQALDNSGIIVDPEDAILRRDANLVILNRFPSQDAAGGAIGGVGITIHNDLSGRNVEDAHPMASITGLQDAIDEVQASIATSIQTVVDNQALKDTTQDQLINATQMLRLDGAALSIVVNQTSEVARNLLPAGTLLVPSKSLTYDTSGTVGVFTGMKDAATCIFRTITLVGSGGGGVAGVSSFNGQVGDVTFSEADPVYTAEKATLALKTDLASYAPLPDSRSGYMMPPEIFTFDGTNYTFTLAAIPKFIVDCMVLSGSSFTYLQQADWSLTDNQITIQNVTLNSGDKVRVGYTIA